MVHIYSVCVCANINLNSAYKYDDEQVLLLIIVINDISCLLKNEVQKIKKDK